MEDRSKKCPEETKVPSTTKGSGEAAMPDSTDSHADWVEIGLPAAEERLPDLEYSQGRIKKGSDWIVVEVQEEGNREEEIVVGVEEKNDEDDEETWIEEDSDNDQDQEASEFSYHIDYFYDDDDDEPRRKEGRIGGDSVLSKIVQQHILPRLPADSLFRMRCVSVTWNRWISSDFFVHAHARNARPLSGVFYRTPEGDTVYASFGGFLRDLPVPFLSFLPEPADVKSSACGLLCCRGRYSLAYYVCNPVTTEWAGLPAPANDHGDDVGLVLVLDVPGEFNINNDYHLVCAYRIRDDDERYDEGGIYGIEYFSSRTWEWRVSKCISAVGRIEPESGVATVGAAHWRTTRQTVVSYMLAADAWQETEWPEGYRSDVRWEIGELGGRLCCTCLMGTVMGTVAVVRVLEDQGWERWKRLTLGPKPRKKKNSPSPLRSQGTTELLFREHDALGWRVVARDMESGGQRMLVENVPWDCADIVPYVSSLVRVKREHEGPSSYSENSESLASFTQQVSGTKE